MFDPLFMFAFFLPIIFIGGVFLLFWARYYKRVEKKDAQSYSWIIKPMTIMGLSLMGISTALGLALFPYFDCNDEYCIQSAYLEMMGW